MKLPKSLITGSNYFINRGDDGSSFRNRPDSFNLIDIISAISGLEREIKLRVCKDFYTLLKNIGEDRFPNYLRSSERYKVKEELAYDEVFCRRVGIPYEDIDEHFVDIDLAMAVFYVKQIREFLDNI